MRHKIALVFLVIWCAPIAVSSVIFEGDPCFGVRSGVDAIVCECNSVFRAHALKGNFEGLDVTSGVKDAIETGAPEEAVLAAFREKGFSVSSDAGFSAKRIERLGWDVALHDGVAIARKGADYWRVPLFHPSERVCYVVLFERDGRVVDFQVTAGRNESGLWFPEGEMKKWTRK